MHKIVSTFPYSHHTKYIIFFKIVNSECCALFLLERQEKLTDVIKRPRG